MLFEPTTDLVIVQGESWHIQVECQDEDGGVVDLTGYTAALKAREELNDTTNLIALATGGAGITITANLGLLDIVMTAAQTAALDFDSAYYEIELYKTISDEPIVVKGPRGFIRLQAEVVT